MEEIVLGIDYGEKRIGFAVSDPSGIIALPLEVRERKVEGDDVDAVLQVCAMKKATRLVVGMPYSLDGSKGPTAEKVEAFITRLHKQTALPIETWDERFSTVTAEQALIQGGTRRDKRKKVIDKLAAQVFLQHYLDVRSAL